MDADKQQQMLNLNGNKVFSFNFEKVKSIIKRIKPNVIQELFYEKVECYANDANELKLSSIIELSNDLNNIKHSIEENQVEDEEEETNSVSKKACEDLEKFLEDVLNSLFNLSIVDQFEEEKNNSKTETTVSKTTDAPENEEKENISVSSTTLEELTEKPAQKNMFSEHKNDLLSNNKQEESKNSTLDNEKMSGVSLEFLNQKFAELANDLNEAIQEVHLEKTKIVQDEFLKTITQGINNVIKKSDSDKTVISDSIKELTRELKTKLQETTENIKESNKILTDDISNHIKNTRDLIESTISKKMEEAIQNNKITSELSAKQNKSLNTIPFILLFSIIIFLGNVFLWFSAAKWYGNSIKYENIQKVQENLSPYEKTLFNEIITKGYANTQENPRHN